MKGTRRKEKKRRKGGEKKEMGEKEMEKKEVEKKELDEGELRKVWFDKYLLEDRTGVSVELLKLLLVVEVVW